MPIELSLIVSIISVIFAAYVGLSNKKRNDKKDSREEAEQSSLVMIKLEYISSGIAEIKIDMNNVKDDNKEIREKLIVQEQSLKSAWKQIDKLNGVEQKG